MLPGPNPIVLPPTTPKAHRVAGQSGENRAAAQSPASPSPLAHLHEIYMGSPCLDAHSFLPAWSLLGCLHRDKRVYSVPQVP